MTINDGGGLFDKYGLIDSTIVALDRLTVQGVANMQIVFDSIQKLGALKNGLKKEEAQREADHHQPTEDV